MKGHLLRFGPAAAAVVVVVGALVLALVTGDDDRSAPDRTTTTTTSAAVAALDWARPAPVDLGGGWRITDAEGDAPILTVLRDGRAVGFVELLDYRLETAAGDDRATLDGHVARYYRDIGDDRRSAPIEHYAFESDAAVHVDTADGGAVRYGFRGTLPDGRPSERTIQWAGVRGGRLVLVSASAHDEGGLFGRDGTEFTSADLDAVADRLDGLVRASGLPEPAPPLP